MKQDKPTTDDLTKHVPEGMTWLRAAISCVPAVGGALNHLLFDKADSIRIKNIELAIEGLGQKIESIGEAKIDVAWFESKEALAALKFLSDKVSYEPDPAKVQAIAKVVAAFGSKAHSSDPRKFSAAEHLARLSVLQMKILSVVASVSPSARELSGGSLTQTANAIWLSDIKVALENGEKFWDGVLKLDEELDILESYNTLRRPQLVVQSEPCYHLTAIGRIAAEYTRTAAL